MAGKRYLYLGLHDSGAGGREGKRSLRVAGLRSGRLHKASFHSPAPPRPAPLLPPPAEVAAAMAYDRAAIADKGVEAATNFHLAEYAEELGES